MTEAEKLGPIEVWLRQATMAGMAIECMIVAEDETTSELDVDSLSMRGAQREMTGHFIGQGYEPVGRWEVTVPDAETVRRFKPKA